jgi:hypothetical protein
MSKAEIEINCGLDAIAGEGEINCGWWLWLDRIEW